MHIAKHGTQPLRCSCRVPLILKRVGACDPLSELCSTDVEQSSRSAAASATRHTRSCYALLKVFLTVSLPPVAVCIL
eukprot:6197091-Pleurochrysis_carterae.AAC.8